ncbi:MAG: hypothetical protein Q9168_006703 [Polycauliona sp. 1 TL-2023]
MAQQRSPDGELVYLHCSSIFSGENAHVRKSKAIRNLLEANSIKIKTLTQDFDLATIVAVAKRLLEDGIFESLPQAKLRFPGLFPPPCWPQAAGKAMPEVKVIKIDPPKAQVAVPILKDGEVKLKDGGPVADLPAKEVTKDKTVHRQQTTAPEMLVMVSTAIDFTEALKDTKRAEEIIKLRRQLELSIEQIEEHQTSLEQHITVLFKEIACRRAELDELERTGIRDMLAADKQHRTEVGSDLETFLDSLPAKSTADASSDSCLEGEDVCTKVEEHANTIETEGETYDQVIEEDAATTDAEDEIDGGNSDFGSPLRSGEKQTDDEDEDYDGGISFANELYTLV